MERTEEEENNISLFRFENELRDIEVTVSDTSLSLDEWCGEIERASFFTPWWDNVCGFEKVNEAYKAGRLTTEQTAIFLDLKERLEKVKPAIEKLRFPYPEL